MYVYITYCYTNLAYMGLGKIIVAQDWAGSFLFKDAS